MSPEILSLIALVIALTSTVINYLVLRLQRDPEVVVYAVPDPQRPTIINLVIENTGKGVARDVRFDCPRDIPARAFGFENAAVPESMMDGPLINGIPSFGPGEKRIITWGQYGGLKAGLGDEVLDISAVYFSSPPLMVKKQKHQTTSRVDIRSFEGTDASHRNWEKKQAEQLEEIAKALVFLTDRSEGALKVTIAPTDNDEEKT
ncbi:hypothetical protein HGG65_04530 [Alteromonadaceae bacterium A_SAG4]|nr:hypothetical protein [Alteromonadaceae bacterium A_SAG4]NKX04311.1 hypothetical protein [Alteromonadaceae bacterium A_SAG6]NKX19418.1 hypothetical protein [Alteromonadaceae bacterium A_SAG8]NKX32966.1 hypothetical protein [Alteromonadaceae bacterium A_SAG3]NKX68640.1 hypothetical protein [Alteromonadaceae bacterium A_SAG7]